MAYRLYLSVEKFYRRWILNNGIGELLGFGLAGFFNAIHVILIGEPVSNYQKFLVLLLASIGGIAEGSCLAFFQWRVLRERYSRLTRIQWIRVTATIAALGWFLGMIPSLYFAPEPTQDGQIEFEMGLWIAILLGIVFGIVLGGLFGLFQWIELRKHACQAWWWIIANISAWFVAMTILFIGPSLVPSGSSLFMIVSVAVISGLLAGIALGLITGYFVLSKLPPRDTNS